MFQPGHALGERGTQNAALCNDPRYQFGGRDVEGRVEHQDVLRRDADSERLGDLERISLLDRNPAAVGAIEIV